MCVCVVQVLRPFTPPSLLPVHIAASLAAQRHRAWVLFVCSWWYFIPSPGDELKAMASEGAHGAVATLNGQHGGRVAWSCPSSEGRGGPTRTHNALQGNRDNRAV